MIPILFDSTETDFTTYGKGKLADALSCVIHETLAGEYELEMEYPVTGALFSELLGGGIIWADNKAYSHSANNAASNRPHTTQPFDIYKIGEEINGVVTVYARHVFYRLGNGAIFEPSYSAFHYIPWWIQYALTNAIPAIADFSVTVVSGGSSVGNIITNEDLFSSGAAFTPLQLIFGDGMALDISTAEVICSGFGLFLYSRRGGDYGASIRYGKNMVGFNREIDETETFNAVVPFWAKDGTVVQGVLVQSTTPLTPVKAKPLDLTAYFDSAPTVAQLTSTAQTWLNDNTPWIVRATIDVDMAVVNDLETASIELGDDVRVYYEDYGVNIIHRVVEYWYDVICEAYQKLRIGTPQTEYVAVTGDTLAGASGGASGGGAPTVEVLTPTVTKTSGASSVSSVYAVRYGNVVFCMIRFNSGNSSVSTGSNTFVGTITDLPLPKETVTGASYIGSTVLLGGLNNEGTITVRVAAANKSASTTATFGINWTYVFEDE